MGRMLMRSPIKVCLLVSMKQRSCANLQTHQYTQSIESAEDVYVDQQEKSYTHSSFLLQMIYY